MKEYLQLGAIILTFFIGIFNLICSSRLSAKLRLTSIASTRRKERLDKLTVYSSKFLALVHPVTLNVFTIKQDAAYVKELFETFYILRMYLDSRFEKDVEIIQHFQFLETKAAEYFMEYNRSEAKHELDFKYKRIYSSNVDRAYMLMNLFIGTEWKRLKLESKRGVTVGLKEWKVFYDEGYAYYRKASAKMRNGENHP